MRKTLQRVRGGRLTKKKVSGKELLTYLLTYDDHHINLTVYEI